MNTVTAINNAQLIIGNGELIDRGSIRFDNTGILDIEQGTSLQADVVLDGSGKTVMPGLIDCHVHLAMPPVVNCLSTIINDNELTTAYRAYDQACQMIRSGITTIRNVGTKYDADITLRNMINSGEIRGPRILASGQVICITCGHCNPLGVEVDDVSQATTAARRQIKKGADLLKMMATGGVITMGDPNKIQLTLEQMIAIREEADRFGKTSCAHCIAPDGIRNAVEAGLHSVEHGTYLDDEICKKMVERGVWLVPTLIATYNEWHPDINIQHDPISERLREKAKPVSDSGRRSFEIALRNGVKIALGTDAGCPFNVPTLYALEVHLYIEHGMTPMDALVCATYKNAQFLKLDKTIGSLEKGKLADLILIDGDPLNNILDLRKVERTYRSGDLLHRS